MMKIQQLCDELTMLCHNGHAQADVKFVSDNVPYSLKVRMIDIYAWKEIVLPELKESE